MENKTVYLALGSNVGNREKNLTDAIWEISNIEGTSIMNVSNIYETEPVGYTNQNKFLNIAAVIQTGLEPLILLEEFQKIEIYLKRTREIHWGPRTIDIDILLYADMKIDLPRLTIPHPRMSVRAFVLVPLKEIYESGKINGSEIDKLISECDDKSGIVLYNKSKLENGRLIIDFDD